MLRLRSLQLLRSITKVNEAACCNALPTRSLITVVESQQEQVYDTQQLPKSAALNRLLYRSKQRGFLELDLLVGLWAERHVHTLDETTLNDLQAVLELENPDLYKWLTFQATPPPALLENKAFQSIRREVQAQLQQHSLPAARASSSAAWVRGWDDRGQNLANAAEDANK